MPEQKNKPAPPRGLKRLFWRAPIWIYRLGLGGLFKERMLLLHHIGRNSGLARQNVLEIVDYDRQKGIYTVASGFGHAADWYKNLLQQPEASITVGRTEYTVTAQPLSPEESGQAMAAYAKRHPKAAKSLMSICGYKVDESEEAYFNFGRDAIPFVILMSR